jgi:curved DNA-binding protein CbpA
METIIVDNTEVDPYFILDVTPADSEAFVMKSFKKKAKIWHPDKLSLQDRQNIDLVKRQEKRFKILLESYEYITNSKQKNRPLEKINRNENIPIKEFDNSNELQNFNTEFEKSHVSTPNSFGYTNKRMADIKDYDNFDYNPVKLDFGNKNFNANDFNRAFEYSQNEQGNSFSQSQVGLYHTTNDGFNAYNGSDLGGAASVSSYNGIMIVGDTFGQSGSGYYDSNYSDYKLSFNSTKNPDKQLNIPTDFKQQNNSNIPLTNAESQEQLNLQMKYRTITPDTAGKSKNEFKLQEQILMKKQQDLIKNKIEQDKKLVLDYQKMFPQHLIESAFNNTLETSSDYVSEENINKRFLTINHFKK